MNLLARLWGFFLLLRTNAGYDRWWEARKLWRGIVNQSRNLVIGAMAYGPNDLGWREKFVRWTAVFPHVARLNLRGELPSSEVANLVGPDDARRVATSERMPSFRPYRGVRTNCKNPATTDVFHQHTRVHRDLSSHAAFSLFHLLDSD